MIEVGQRVRCVDDGPGHTLTWVQCPLRRGAIYTVLEVYVRRIRSLCVDGDPAHFWSEKRFEPVVSRPTDISVLERLLNPINHEVLDEPVVNEPVWIEWPSS